MPALAVIVEVAEALKVALDAKEFDLAFTPVRSYADWNEELPDTEAGLKVDVVPNTGTPALDSVGDHEWPVTIDVLIRKRFGIALASAADGRIPNSEIDPLVKMTQDIWEFVAPAQPDQAGRLETAGGYSAAWDPDATRLMSHYVRPHLRRLRQFTAWIRVGYLVSKETG